MNERRTTIMRNADLPQTARLVDQIKVGMYLFGYLAIVFVFLMAIISAGASIYSRIYEQGRSAGTQDLLLIMERMQKMQPVQQPIQTAPSIQVQPSPYESVCRKHNGVKSVVPMYGQWKIECHDGFTEYSNAKGG